MNLRKLLSMGLACTIATSCISGCGIGSNQKQSSDGKVTITVGRWPEKGTPAYESKMKQVASFNEKYPNIEVVGDTYVYDTKTFTAKASGKTLPTLYSTWFTEVDKIIDGGYAIELTDALEQLDWLSKMNSKIVKYVSGDDGKVYGIPYKVYSQGLYINRKLFAEAGLVDQNGMVIIPQTYDEVYEAAKTIKEKTGKAGFGLATMNNQGGWQAINVAWAHGTEFLSKSEDGKYTSTLNTPETVEAFEWIKKMRAAKVFPDNTNLVTNDLQTLFASNQIAMYIGEPSYISGMANKFGMKPEDIILASIPEGSSGAFSQMGGDLYMISANATPEQVDACLKWIDFIGHGPSLDDIRIENAKESCRLLIEQGGVVLPKDAFDIWNDEERLEKLYEARKEYVNIPEENVNDYYAFESVTIKPEPEVGCQELYAEMDKVIQEIYSNADANLAEHIKTASDNWQINCLDNLK